MSNSGSGDGPTRGRRPAPRRPAGGGQRPSTPQRPAPPPRAAAEDDADERTQALDLSTLDLDSGAEEEDAGEATVAMQLPEGLFDDASRGGGGKKTIMGHPGVSARTASAVRGSAPAPRRNETLAMDQRSAQAVAQRGASQRSAPPPEDDEGEATMAMNVDSLLAQIDERQSQRAAPAPAPASAPSFDDDDDDEGEGATMAMSLDDLKAKAASVRTAPAGTPAAASARPAPARPAPAPSFDEEDENESTMAVDMSDVVGQIAARNAGRPAPGRPAPASFDDDEDESEATMAMSVDDMRAEMQRKAAAAAQQQAPAARRAAPAVATAAAGALGAAASTEGLLGPIAYALSFDGRKQQIEDSLAAIEAGTAPPELARDAERYRAEHAALDPEAAKKGWITFGAIAGGLTALIVVLGLVL